MSLDKPLVVYLGAPLGLYASPVYDSALQLLLLWHPPSATILPSRGLWPTTGTWLRTYRAELSGVTWAYFLAGDDGLLTAGVLREWWYLARRQNVPCFLLDVLNRCVRPMIRLIRAEPLGLHVLIRDRRYAPRTAPSPCQECP